MNDNDIGLGCWVVSWEGEGVEVMSERSQNKTALYLTKIETERPGYLTLKQICPTLQQA